MNALPLDEAEIDIWWGGYAGRAMLPSFVACIAATGVLIGLAIYLTEECDLPGDSVRYTLYAVAGVLWAGQLLRWGLRMVGTNYRITTRRLYCWTGLFTPPASPMDLVAVTQVRVKQSWLERLLGVGRVRIYSGQEKLVLAGLAQPRRVVAILEHRVKEVKGG